MNQYKLQVGYKRGIRNSIRYILGTQGTQMPVIDIKKIKKYERKMYGLLKIPC